MLFIYTNVVKQFNLGSNKEVDTFLHKIQGCLIFLLYLFKIAVEEVPGQF